MPSTGSVYIQGLEIREKLAKFALQARDMRYAMKKYGDYLVDTHIPRQFSAQGTPKRWAALSPEYKRWKQMNYGNLPKLVLTDTMRTGFKAKATARQVKITNVRRWWTAHQYGVPGRNLPARPMIQFTQRDDKALVDIAQVYIINLGIGMGL